MAPRSTRPTNPTAAQHLQQWIQAGYFPKDVNAIEYTNANLRFGKGEGVFMFNGDWQNASYDKDRSSSLRASADAPTSIADAPREPMMIRALRAMAGGAY